MFKNLKKYSSVIFFVGITILCVILLFFIFAVLDRYSGSIEDKISEKATLYSLKTDYAISDPMSNYEQKTSFVAGYLEDLTNIDSFSNGLVNLKKNYPEIKDIRYIKDGIMYSSTIGISEYSEKYAGLIELANKGEVATYGIIYDYDYKMNLVAFCAPVKNNPILDSVILYYNEGIFKIENVTEVLPGIESSEFSLVCTKNGRIISAVYPEGGIESIVTVKENFDFIKELNDTLSSSVSAELTSLISSENDNTVTFKYNGESFALAVKHNESCPEFVSVSLYRSNSMDGNQDDALASIGAMLIILCILIPLILLGIVVAQKIRNKKIEQGKLRNEEFKCLSKYGLQEEIKVNMQRYPGTKFAIVGTRLKHYRYLVDTYPAKVNSIVHGIRDFLNNNLEMGELLATADDGEFVLMLHFRTMEQLTKRIWSISNLISNKIGSQQYQVRLDFGIYEIMSETTTTPKDMISNAFKTIDADPSKSALSNITVFSDIFHENYLKSAEIEVKMELALENEEFKVFFQPKLNIVKNTIDGCEALVRWYDEDKGEYRVPGTFLPLFEQNGFISKLDKYVFLKSCEFIGLRLSQNLPVFPTSVNISKYTAFEEGFMDYYVSIKNKYGVPDNFITLELSESVAASSYKELNKLATSIHNNKFLVSIDDYGSGYSSFNVLKSIKTDEIKIDSMFLQKGINAETDATILANIIKLARDLGIKTVQEGVETQEQLDYVRRAGCIVVQGYCLSKPLSMLDYIKFIDARTLEDERRAREHDYSNMN